MIELVKFVQVGPNTKTSYKDGQSSDAALALRERPRGLKRPMILAHSDCKDARAGQFSFSFLCSKELCHTDSTKNCLLMRV